jgi:hypothetical protein
MGWMAPSRYLSAKMAILACYRAHLRTIGSTTAAAPQPSATDRVAAYVEQQRADLPDITNRKPILSNAQFEKAPGFLRQHKSGGWELLVSPKRFRKVFPDAEDLMIELRDLGQARTENGKQPKLTTKVQVRRERGAERVYCILIGSLADE